MALFKDKAFAYKESFLGKNGSLETFSLCCANGDPSATKENITL